MALMALKKPQRSPRLIQTTQIEVLDNVIQKTGTRCSLPDRKRGGSLVEYTLEDLIAPPDEIRRNGAPKPRMMGDAAPRPRATYPGPNGHGSTSMPDVLTPLNIGVNNRPSLKSTRMRLTRGAHVNTLVASPPAEKRGDMPNSRSTLMVTPGDLPALRSKSLVECEIDDIMEFQSPRDLSQLRSRSLDKVDGGVISEFRPQDGFISPIVKRERRPSTMKVQGHDAGDLSFNSVQDAICAALLRPPDLIDLPSPKYAYHSTGEDAKGRCLMRSHHMLPHFLKKWRMELADARSRSYQAQFYMKLHQSEHTLTS